MGSFVPMMDQPRYSLWACLLPFAVSVSLLFVGNLYPRIACSYYSELSLLLGGCCALGIASWHGVRVSQGLRGVYVNIGPILPTFLFIILIGAVATSWLLGGIIPSGIYLGITYLHPSYFLMTVTLFAGMMGLACGSSWLTIGTMGIAFLGIGTVLGFAPAVVAGAIISGAYFGDKLTPLSETTVLAASMTKTPLLRHVSYMLWTSVATFVITLLLFFVWGLMYDRQGADHTGMVPSLLQKSFDIRAVWLMAPVSIMLLTLLRFNPYITLLIGVLFGHVVAFFYQMPLLEKLSGCTHLSTGAAMRVLLSKTFWGVSVYDEHPVMNKLLHAGGVVGMWSTISVVLASLVLSGIMEGTGLLDELVRRVEHVESRNKLIVWTTLAAIFFNITVADQYLAIILTAKMFGPLYRKQGLACENASRAIEDAATVTSPLVPWNTCGAAQANALGIGTLAYLPYCFYNLLSPIVGIAFMYFGIRIKEDVYATKSEDD